MTRINQAGDWNGLLLTIKDRKAKQTRRVDFASNGIVPCDEQITGPLLQLPDDYEPPEILCDMAASFMGVSIAKLRPGPATRNGRVFSVCLTRN